MCQVSGSVSYSYKMYSSISKTRLAYELAASFVYPQLEACILNGTSICCSYSIVLCFFLSIIAMFWNKYSPPTDLLLCCVRLETARTAYQWDLRWNKRSPGIFVSQSHHLSFVSLESCQWAQKNTGKPGHSLAAEWVSARTAEVMPWIPKQVNKGKRGGKCGSQGETS